MQEKIKVANKWADIDKEKPNPVRNSGQDYLRFLNTRMFSEEAHRFLRNKQRTGKGFYISPNASQREKDEYWTTQLSRIINGYTVGGVRITGRHYYYLNFVQIKARPIDIKTGIENSDAPKIWTFPRFLDHNYYLFHELEKILIEGPYRLMSKEQKQQLGIRRQGMVIAKSRRKGMSFLVGGGVLGYNFLFQENSKSTLAAFETSHFQTLNSSFKMCLTQANKHTEFGQPLISNQKDYKKSGFIGVNNDGQEYEDGLLSEYKAVSFKDNPYKDVGLSNDLVIFEEAGKFDNLIDAYDITEPTFRDGDYYSGISLVFGCVCAGTKVYDSIGAVRNIEDLSQSDGIIGYNGDSVSKQVINWFKPPEEKECYRVSFNNGDYIECSYDHPLLMTRADWRHEVKGENIKTSMYEEAENICVNDQLLMPSEVPIFGGTKVHYARELGLMIGDGNCSINSTPSLSVSKREVLKYMVDKYSNFKGSITSSHDYAQNDGNEFKQLSLPWLREYLQCHGLYGLVKDDKRLPSDVHTFDRESVAELLAGYFDADGNVCYNANKDTTRVVLTSVVSDLLYEVKYQLLKFGIHCSIYKENRNNEPTEEYKGQKPYVYRLYISKIEDVKRFRDNIPILIQNNIDKLNAIGDKIGYQSIPRDVNFEINPRNNKEGYFNSNRIKDLRYVTVTSVEKIGRKKVYNLNCSANHNYISNGIITRQTGGEAEGGAKDFAEMFYNPEGWDLKAYENIYDENAVGKCGWFIDDLWYKPGEIDERISVDEHGNSHRETAYDLWKKSWERKKKTSEQSAKNHLTQYPLTPAHSFLRTSGTLFDTMKAQEVVSYLMTHPDELDKSYVVDLYFDSESNVRWEHTDKKPIREFPLKSNREEGAVELFELPQKIAGEIPPTRYIAGLDPYDNDYTEDKRGSLGSIFIFDRFKDRIVAEYTGRPDRANKFYENCRKLLLLYNARALYERANKNIYAYFKRMNSLNLLADEPEWLKEKGFSRGRGVGNLSKGFHPNKEINNFGREKYDDWTRELAYGEEEEQSERVNMDTIRSMGLLKETIAWSDGINADRISAMVGLFVYRESLMTVNIDKEKDVSEMVNDPFIKNMLGGNQYAQHRR